MRTIGSGSACLLACLLVATLAHADGLEGRWRLVEQNYGSGQSNQANLETPLGIEFTRDGASLAGRIWSGADRSRAVAWPALVTADAPRPVTLLERRFAPGGREVTVRYRVRPSASDDLVLEITETYRAGDDARSLSGTVDVVFDRGGKRSGGYTLQRRFERLP